MSADVAGIANGPCRSRLIGSRAVIAISGINCQTASKQWIISGRAGQCAEIDWSIAATVSRPASAIINIIIDALLGDRGLVRFTGIATAIAAEDAITQEQVPAVGTNCRTGRGGGYVTDERAVGDGKAVVMVDRATGSSLVLIKSAVGNRCICSRPSFDCTAIAVIACCRRAIPVESAAVDNE